MEALPAEAKCHVYSFLDEESLYEMSTVSKEVRGFILGPDSDFLWKEVCPYPVKPISIPTWRLWCARCHHQTVTIFVSDMNRVMQANSYIGQLQTFTKWKTPASWIATTAGLSWFYMKCRNTYFVSQDWGSLIKQATGTALTGGAASLSLLKIETSMIENLDAVIEHRDYEQFLPEDLWLQRESLGANIAELPLKSQLELRILAYIESDPVRSYYASWVAEEPSPEDAIGRLKVGMGQHAMKWHKAHLLLQLVHNMPSSTPPDAALHFTNLSITALKESCDTFKTLKEDLNLLLSEESSLSPEQKLWSVLEMQKIHASVSKRDQFDYPAGGLDDAAYRSMSDLIALNGDLLYGHWNVIAGQAAKIVALQNYLEALEGVSQESKYRGILALCSVFMIVEQSGVNAFYHAVETVDGEICEFTPQAILEHGASLQDNWFIMAARCAQMESRLQQKTREASYSRMYETEQVLRKLADVQVGEKETYLEHAMEHARAMRNNDQITSVECDRLVDFVTELFHQDETGDRGLIAYSISAIKQE